jgi:predicted amidophosphoribosyltransferase
VRIARCSACIATVPVRAERCAKCGATFHGDIASLSDRLEAEERLDERGGGA